MSKKNPNLTAEQKLVMFEDGTEPPGTSELNHEKRDGSYHCANCGIKLFDSETKYESGSGWPSFFKSLPDVFETKTDHLLGLKENVALGRLIPAGTGFPELDKVRLTKDEESDIVEEQS